MKVDSPVTAFTSGNTYFKPTRPTATHRICPYCSIVSDDSSQHLPEWRNTAEVLVEYDSAVADQFDFRKYIRKE